jgi:amylosucrase
VKNLSLGLQTLQAECNRLHASCYILAVISMRSIPPAGQTPPLDGRALFERAQADLEPDLKALSDVDRRLFWRRAETHVPQLRGVLRALYGSFDLDALVIEALRMAAATATGRSAELRELDQIRSAEPDWFQRPDMIGYVAYTDRFGSTIRGVGDRIGYLQELGVKYFHLMSVIRPREGANDGGFAVLDYCDVDPDLGTLDELRALAAQLRAAGISLCIDFVMNHTAAEHEWAIKAQAGDQRYLDYYLTYPDRSIPDKWELSLPEVFPEIAPGNFTWSEPMQRWVWTTFNSYQWDLNYANPTVLMEMAKAMGFLANVGVEILRLDAVAFTWKRMGTDCQNQPEAHLIAQALRCILAVGAPATICKAEAIVGPDQLVPYLGTHHVQGVRVERQECELAYHNQLMVMLWSSVATRKADLITHAHIRMQSAPSSTAWCTYVRCHDDIGWAVTDQDAGSAMVGGASHRQFLSEFYRGDFPTSFAHGVAFSTNEETGDQRTCGSAAALCGIDDGRLRADDAVVDVGVQRLLMMYGVILGFGGIPLIYMGDELGLGNDHGYVDVPEHADDSRWIHRPAMPWAGAAAQRHDVSTVEGRVFSGFQRMIHVRASIPAIHAAGSVEWFWTGHPSVLGFVRRHPAKGAIMVLANVSDQPAMVDADLPKRMQFLRPDDRLAPGTMPSQGPIRFAPLAVRWIVDAALDDVVPTL